MKTQKCRDPGTDGNPWHFGRRGNHRVLLGKGDKLYWRLHDHLAEDDWLKPSQERRRILQKYGFLCSCPPCLGNTQIVTKCNYLLDNHPDLLRLRLLQLEIRLKANSTERVAKLVNEGEAELAREAACLLQEAGGKLVWKLEMLKRVGEEASLESFLNGKHRDKYFWINIFALNKVIQIGFVYSFLFLCGSDISVCAIW